MFLASTGHATFYLDNISGNFRVVQDTTERMRIDSSGIISGRAFRADQGVPNNADSSTVGFAFGADGDTGMFSVGTGTAAGGPIAFYTNNDERMRIDSSGNLLVGRTNAGWNGGGGILSSGAVESVVAGSYSMFGRGVNTGTIINLRYNNAVVGTISTDGSSTSYNTSSDYRLKEDVVEMEGSLDRLKALKPCNFRWISDGTRVDGFLAHEAQEVVPEAVTGTKDAITTEEYEVVPAVLDEEGNEVTPAEMGTREVPDYQGIDQAKLVPLLTKALQEAVAKIEALEARVEALENIE